MEEGDGKRDGDQQAADGDDVTDCSHDGNGNVVRVETSGMSE